MKTSIAKDLASLVYQLVTNDDNCDMSIIESDIMSAMKIRGLAFVPYFTAMGNAYEKYVISRFDTTADYFFDAINAVKISEGKIENLINECIA